MLLKKKKKGRQTLLSCLCLTYFPKISHNYWLNFSSTGGKKCRNVSIHRGLMLAGVSDRPLLFIAIYCLCITISGTQPHGSSIPLSLAPGQL